MLLRFFALLTIPLLSLSQLSGQAERQAEIWHFGEGQVIVFEGGQPTISSGSAMVAFEGCVSISDSNGNLQFYSNGGGVGIDQAQDGVIWNKNNDRMYDWATMGGGGISARQSSIAMPDPSGAPGLYYLFTMEDRENATVNRPPGNGLSYYKIDMNQDANLGKVTDVNERYFPDVVEALDATPMADGSGYWVIANLNQGGAPKIVTVPVTATGVGEPIVADFPALTDQYTFSPDGAYLYTNDNLYAYDNAAGTVGELIRNFPNSISVSAGFTADSRFTYLIESVDFNAPRLVRYDLLDGTRLEIALLTDEIIQTTSSSPFQLGPNGNLYYLEEMSIDFGPGSAYNLNEIACPSSPTPQFNRGRLQIIDNSPTFRLPNLPQYVDNIFIGTGRADTLTLDVLTIENCPNSELELMAREIGDAYLWDDGSTDSILIVTEPGEYCVTITTACSATIDCQVVTPTEAPNADEYVLNVTPVDGTEICDGREAVVRVRHGGGDTSAVDITFFDGTVGDSTIVDLTTGMEITATVVDSCGNVAELAFGQVIAACTCDDPVFPEIISANSDGLNDEFRAFSQCDLRDYSLIIFNRFGQEVFSTNTFTEGWDGSKDGNPQNIGTYLYLSSFRVEGMEEVMKVEGQFSLVR